MCVLLFDAINGCSFKQSHVKHLLFRKTDVLKIRIGKKIWRNALALKSIKIQDISVKTFNLALPSSELSFAYKIVF